MNTQSSQSDSVPEIEKIILKPLRVRFSKIFGRYALEKMRVGVYPLPDHIFDELEVQITMNILGQPKIQTYTVEMEVPDGWWNQLKYDHLPSWVQRISPLRWKTIKRDFVLNHMALLPKFDKVPPGEEVVLFTDIPSDEPGITNTTPR